MTCIALLQVVRLHDDEICGGLHNSPLRAGVQLCNVLAWRQGAGRGIESDRAEARSVIAHSFWVVCRVRGWNASVSVSREHALASAVRRFDGDHIKISRGLDGRPAHFDVFPLVQKYLGCRDTVLPGHTGVGLATSALPWVVVQIAGQSKALEADEVGVRQLELARLRISHRACLSVREMEYGPTGLCCPNDQSCG